jgi:hypothetical protein
MAKECGLTSRNYRLNACNRRSSVHEFGLSNREGADFSLGYALGNSDILSDSGRDVTRGSECLRDGEISKGCSRRGHVLPFSNGAAITFQPNSRAALQGGIGSARTL